MKLWGISLIIVQHWECLNFLEILRYVFNLFFCMQLCWTVQYISLYWFCFFFVLDYKCVLGWSFESWCKNHRLQDVSSIERYKGTWSWRCTITLFFCIIFIVIRWGHVFGCFVTVSWFCFRIKFNCVNLRKLLLCLAFCWTYLL